MSSQGELLPAVTPPAVSLGRPSLGAAARGGPPPRVLSPSQSQALLAPTPRPLLLGSCLGAWLHCLEVSIIISILQMRRLRLGEAKQFAQGHRANTGYSGIQGQISLTTPPPSTCPTDHHMDLVQVSPSLSLLDSEATGGRCQGGARGFLVQGMSLT